MNDQTATKLATTGQPQPISPPQMLAVAIEKGASMEQLEKLMDLQERWEAREAQKAYTVAMSDFRGRCPMIIKTKKAHNNMYAGLAETIDQIKDLLAECGLSHSWATDVQGDIISVTCRVTHVQGHSESTTIPASPDTSGSKNAIQAVGSTITYLQRYTLFSILGLASQEDSDGNMDTPPDAIDQLQACETVEELQSTFKELWRKYPKARKELTGAKDIRKKELTND